MMARLTKCPHCHREFYPVARPDEYCAECWKAWCKMDGSFEAREQKSPPMTNPTPLDRAIMEAVEARWLPIESAPKDGTRVIVKTPCFYWNTDVCQHLARGTRAVEARYATSPGRPEPHWIEWCGDEKTYSSSWIVAEAWMPLPAQPAAIRKDQP